jgi:hypothetical protein
MEYAVSLILFIKIFSGHLADQSCQDNEGNQIGKGHEGIGHVPYIPDNVQVDSLDDRTDKKKRDERDPEGEDDSDAK